jgi:hypothetical protein
MKLWALLLILFVGSGCSTLSNRQRTIAAMFLTGSIAGTVGALSAPQNESAPAHAALWAGSAAAGAGLVGLYAFDEDARSKEFERKLKVVTEENQALRGEAEGAPVSPLAEAASPFGKELPPEYQRLVRPGRWSVYKLNQWIMSGENTLIHQDRMVKIIPPQFSGGDTEEPVAGSKAGGGGPALSPGMVHEQKGREGT